jgi:hypothetical protein
MGESLEKELKNGCCWQKNEKAAENNLQKNRLSMAVYSLSKFTSCFYSCICKSENTASIPNL